MAALLFIFDALLTLVVVAFLLRLLMPMVRADFRNPIGQAVLQLTSPVVMPLRRLLPPAGRVDLAAMVALLLVQLAKTALLLLVAGGSLALASLLYRALHDLASTVLQFYFVAVLVYALLSWVAPGGHGPGAQLLARICEPLLRPLRRIVPPIGGLDLSALFVLIGLQALQILLR
jgi:YggT family protein